MHPCISDESHLSDVIRCGLCVSPSIVPIVIDLQNGKTKFEVCLHYGKMTSVSSFFGTY
jgi:hypothetical protein